MSGNYFWLNDGGEPDFSNPERQWPQSPKVAAESQAMLSIRGLLRLGRELIRNRRRNATLSALRYAGVGYGLVIPPEDAFPIEQHQAPDNRPVYVNDARLYAAIEAWAAGDLGDIHELPSEPQQ